MNRKNKPYLDGELEVILKVAPTVENIRWLSIAFDRSEEGIKKVFEIAFGVPPLDQKKDIQAQKVFEAKKRVGIVVGRQTPP